MKPLSECPAGSLRGVRGLLLDIDDTLTTDGRLTAAAYGALERLHSAGLAVVPVTGRPAGWCDHIARMWPVDAVVGENGAFYFRYDHTTRRMHKRFVHDARERARARRRLDALGASILAQVPGTALASDQRYREADVAIDYCEDVPPLTAEAVARVVAMFEAEGATARVSSIHVNGWFGHYDKLGMTRIALRECLDVDLEDRRREFVFVGDSPNDAPMFDFFPLGVGVANVTDFRGHLSAEPAFVTHGRSGDGLVELVDALLAARRGE